MSRDLTTTDGVVFPALSSFDWCIVHVTSTRELNHMNVPLLQLTLEVQHPNPAANTSGRSAATCEEKATRETIMLELTAEELRGWLTEMLPIQEEIKALGLGGKGGLSRLSLMM